MRAAGEGAVCEASVSADGRGREEGGAVREPGDAGDGACWWWWSGCGETRLWREIPTSGKD